MPDANVPTTTPGNNPTPTKPWNDRNQCRFTGRVGGDPRINTKGANPVVTGTIYVTNEYDDRAGVRKKKEARIGFVMYGEQAMAFAQTIGKGDRVEVEGQIHGNSWKDKNEQSRYDLELTANPEKSKLLVKFIPKELRKAA